MIRSEEALHEIDVLIAGNPMTDKNARQQIRNTLMARAGAEVVQEGTERPHSDDYAIRDALAGMMGVQIPEGWNTDA